MRFIKSFYDAITGKKEIIRHNIDGIGNYLAARLQNLQSKNAVTFFEHSIICAITDAYEYFLSVDSPNNIFYKNIESLSEEAGERFIKWESIYHTLMFTGNMREDGEAAEFELSLFNIYDFSSSEKDEYYIFKSKLKENEAGFIIEFSRTAVCDIFGISEITTLETSFIYNFYYNCYTDFYRSYTKYAFMLFPENDVHRRAFDVECGMMSVLNPTAKS